MPARSLEVGINSDLVLQGIAEASQNYANSLLAFDLDFSSQNGGPTEKDRTILRQLNPDVIIEDVLGLTEDETIIATSEEFVREREKGYVERQYIFDAAVGAAVAQELHGVTSSEEARILLPHQAVVIVEVNANRGFPRGFEDSYGCYGLSQGYLGHVIMDAYYAGAEALYASDKAQEEHIDYMPEPGSFPMSIKPNTRLPRNGVRIRVRPSYPLVPEHVDRMSPREVFEARVNPSDEPDERLLQVRDEYAVLRGEYRICRAVSIGHNLGDWEAQDFESTEDSISRGARI